MTQLFNQAELRTQRKQLRHRMPFAELLLWYHLRRKQFNGYKFRRQASVGRFIVDFYCSRARLAIEVDGDSHYEAGALGYDRQRQAYLQSLGVIVLRFTNAEIYRDRGAVLAVILQHLTARPPLSPPSQGGERFLPLRRGG